MAITDLIFGSPKYIGSLQVDAMITEVHSRTAQVTEYTVEDGSVITDHIVNNPKMLTINGIVTDVPNTIFGGIASLFGESKVNNADQILNNIMDKRTRVTVVTGLKVYNSMVLIDYSVTRDKDAGDTLMFNATLKEILIVRTELVILPAVGNLKNVADPIAEAGTTTSGQTYDDSIYKSAENLADRVIGGF